MQTLQWIEKRPAQLRWLGFAGFLAAGMLTFFAIGCGSSAAGSGSTTTTTTTTTTTSGPPAPPTVSGTQNVIRGVDVSWMTQLQTLGYSWEDETGVQQNALQILKNHGVTAVRIRTFVNPTITATALNVGDTDQTGSIALAQTASQMGFQVMIDFHYSDTWADPGHQATPAAWANDSYAEMESDLYNYTYNFMTALLAAGVTPAWVQVGNEIDPGMLLPTGSTSNAAQLAGLINQGYQAVKKVSPASKVIIHHSGLSSLSNLEWFYDLLTANGASFDILGFSYYDGPGTLTTSAANLATMAARYNKPVMICEIGDTVTDVMGSEYDLKSALEALAAVPNQAGLGVFYWEPEAPNDATTSSYAMGAVTETTGKLLQFTGVMDQYLFTGGTSGNQVINPRFASGLNGWQYTASASGVVATQAGGNGTELVITSTAAHTANVTQDEVSLPDGNYTLTAWVESSGGQSSATLNVLPVGGTTMSVNLPTASTWTQVQISNVPITEGEATIRLSVNGNAGNWVRIESVSFTAN
jgi:arabinogalactan endo-1,4-beta-galactosidase